MVKKLGDKHKNSIRLAARYLLITKRECHAAEVYQNMTFKNGKTVRINNQSCSLGTLRTKMSKHPVFRKSATKPYKYTCDIDLYREYFDDDPFFNWDKSNNFFDGDDTFGGRIL
tara:strand:+ start:4858 stop:5199 length:342 start_codon:yes stop_codon:yes gene_type:complete